MQPSKWLIAALAVVVAFLLLRKTSSSDSSMPSGSTSGADDTITYQGQSIKLTRAYSTYEDYKDDPNNIAKSEYTHVQNLIMSAAVAPTYPDRDSLIHATMQLKFPGYGLMSGGEQTQSDSSTLQIISIEIPHADKSRFLTFRGRNGQYTLIDDFIESDSKQIEVVHDQAGQLLYSTMNGVALFTRTPSK